MADRYFIGQISFNSGPSLEISKDEYDKARAAINSLLHAVDAEEKYDGLIENYREFEDFMLGQAFQSLLSTHFDDNVWVQSVRTTTARRLSNFMSSVRLYQDSVERHVRAITGDAETASKVSEEKSRQFDNRVSYRALEALRNHAQHYALPVHGFTVARRRAKEMDYIEHEFSPHIDVSELAENRDFHPPKTLAELKRGPNKLKLKTMVREYVESLSTVHQRFRELTQECIGDSKQHILGLKLKWLADKRAAHDLGIAVFPGDDKGNKTALETNLSKALFEYHAYLQRRHSHLVGFTRRRIAY